jgi:hypothetical protein
VANGGWLDGSLNVLAGVEVLRRLARRGEPPVTVRLVNWADQEGARFGRSLFGSSAAAGLMDDQDELRHPKDAEGCALPEVLVERGVELTGRRRLAGSSRAPRLTWSCASSRGRCWSRWSCRSASCGGRSASSATRSLGPGGARGLDTDGQAPRRLAGGAKLELEIREIAKRTGEGAVCTMGGVVTRLGIVTSVVETSECLLDQRHLDGSKLAGMLEEAKAAAGRFAREEDLEVA